MRTVHSYFPNADDQIIALGEWFDRGFYPGGVRIAEGPDDLARYFHDIHEAALKSPIARALAVAPSPVWREVRQRRRAERLDAIRRSVAAIGAPRRATEDATAMLLGLSGADASWTMHDYGLPLDRIPDAIARTVQLVVDDLKSAAARPRSKHATRLNRQASTSRATDAPVPTDPSTSAPTRTHEQPRAPTGNNDPKGHGP